MLLRATTWQLEKEILNSFMATDTITVLPTRTPSATAQPLMWQPIATLWPGEHLTAMTLTTTHHTHTTTHTTHTHTDYYLTSACMKAANTFVRVSVVPVLAAVSPAAAPWCPVGVSLAAAPWCPAGVSQKRAAPEVNGVQMVANA